MIDLRNPLAVLATRLPWAQMERNVAPVFTHKHRAGKVVDGFDLFGPTHAVHGAGVSAAGRPRFK